MSHRGEGGGPKTPRGKRASRRNAVKHGLAAKTLLPEILDRDLVREGYRRLGEEWQPDTPTEEFFVREMARHEAALERIQAMEHAVLCRGARSASTFEFGDEGDSDSVDAALAGAATSDALDRIARYRKPHERAYLKSLKALREAKASAKAENDKSPRESRPAFGSEQECEAYLAARLSGDAAHCPRCAGKSGKWLASRKVWQCRSCKRQTGIRVTTVMERSRVALLAWFRAIETLLNNPAASTAELAAATDIRREATVRHVARQVRQAMNSSQRSSLLAGLDRVLGVSAHGRAEPAVSEN